MKSGCTTNYNKQNFSRECRSLLTAQIKRKIDGGALLTTIDAFEPIIEGKKTTITAVTREGVFFRSLVPIDDAWPCCAELSFLRRCQNYFDSWILEMVKVIANVGKYVFHNIFFNKN